MDQNDTMDDSDNDFVTSAPPDPKQEFKGLVAQIQAASRHIDTTYARLIAAAAPFDKELVRKLEGAKKADAELFDYVKSKAEVGQLPQGVASGLLGR